jgi:putative transposase
MARGKKHTAVQIVNLLRQVEVGVANGKTLPQACKEAEIVEQTYYRWRKEYGGLKVDQARRLKELEQENAKTEASGLGVEPGEAGVEGHRLGKCMVRSVFASAGSLLTQSGLRKCIRPLASRPLLATRP